MSFSPHSFHLLKLFIPICIIIATGYYLSNSQTQTPILSSVSSPGSSLNHLYTVATSSQKSTFVQQALQTEIDGPFNNTALSELCRSKEWTPGLIVKCDAPQGGIGNVRNVFLNCIRYAIEAGATSFIVPEIIARGDELTDLTTQDIVPFSYFFDQPFFISSLSEACPQIKIIPDINDLWDVPSTARPVALQPQDLSTSFLEDTPTVLAAPGNWSNSFREFLNSSQAFSATKPILIDLGTPLLQFPLDYDSPNFVATFGRILRFREDTRKLASTVLYALNRKHNLNLDPSASGIPTGKFYGAHLRTAADAMAAGWTSYAVQSTNYITAARQYHLPLIYLTSGNPLDTAQFTDLAGNLSISIATKTELLSTPEFADELAQMEKLTWDQQALIDWEVLLRCSIFGGTWESSFGWNIAMRRHIVVGGGTWFKKGEINQETTTPAPEPVLITSAPPADFTPIIAGELNSFLPAEVYVSKATESLFPPASYTQGVESFLPPEVYASRATESLFPPASYTPGAESFLPPDAPVPTVMPRRVTWRRGSEGVRERDDEPQAFKDSASVIFGAEGQGNYFELSLWP